MKRKTMANLLFVGWMVSGMVWAQSLTIPATPAGKRLDGFLAMIGTDDKDKMQSFVRDFDKSFLEKLPEEEQMEFFMHIHDDEGGLEVVSIDESNDYELTAIVKGKRTGQNARLTLSVVANPPHRINGISIALTNSPPNLNSKAKKDETEVLKYLESLENTDQFSGAILIAKNGQPIIRKAYGLASREYESPNRLDTKFNIGSICKSFTQVAIGQLIEQGKLTLDDTIGSLLPDYPNRQAREKVTIRQLLSMTSGIGDIFNEKFRASAKDNLERSLTFFRCSPAILSSSNLALANSTPTAVMWSSERLSRKSHSRVITTMWTSISSDSLG